MKKATPQEIKEFEEWFINLLVTKRSGEWTEQDRQRVFDMHRRHTPSRQDSERVMAEVIRRTRAKAVKERDFDTLVKLEGIAGDASRIVDASIRASQECEHYTPTAEDVDFVRTLEHTLAHGGTWGTSLGIFRIDKENKKLILVDGDCPILNRHRATWAEIGYEVVDGRRK